MKFHLTSSTLTSLWTSASLSLFATTTLPKTVQGAGHIMPKEYDVILVGGGVGGCVMAQSIMDLDGTKEVLIIERGLEPGPDTKNIVDIAIVNFDPCIEKYVSTDGMLIGTGNCFGGATMMNTGVWVEEHPEWILERIAELTDEPFFNASEIQEAIDWVRDVVMPTAQIEPDGSVLDEVVNQLFNASASLGYGPNPLNELPGSSVYLEDTSFRGFSIFNNVTGDRRAAGDILNRNHPKLTVMLNTTVDKVNFDNTTATCVAIVGGEDICVKSGGRIYLTAGPFHTPELLIKSGIGPGGKLVDNAEVGENLSDKPALIAQFSLNQGYDLEVLAYQQMVFTATMPAGLKVIYEPVYIGTNDGAIVQAFERNFVTRSLRGEPATKAVADFLVYCTQVAKSLEAGDITRDEFLAGPCAANIGLIDSQCDRDFVTLIALLSEPSSKGRVFIDENGELQVTGNWLSDPQEIASMGAGLRLAWELTEALSDPVAPVEPAYCDPANQTEFGACLFTSCADMLYWGGISVIESLTLFQPELKNATDALIAGYLEAPPSKLIPYFVEAVLNLDLPDPDPLIGQFAIPNIITPHHFCASARIGSVIDTNFKVMGVEGLYIADASSLPTTSRGNVMATVFAFARLAAIRYTQEVPPITLEPGTTWPPTQPPMTTPTPPTPSEGTEEPTLTPSAAPAVYGWMVRLLVFTLGFALW